MLRRTPLKTQRHATGPNGATRIAVIMRDDSHCVRCGVHIRMGISYSIHHRLPRGRGGSNRLSNLLLLCGSAVGGCHGWLESYRRVGYRDGFLLRTEDDSLRVPVLCARRGLILLTNNGEWLPTNGEGAT